MIYFKYQNITVNKFDLNYSFQLTFFVVTLKSKLFY